MPLIGQYPQLIAVRSTIRFPLRRNIASVPCPVGSNQRKPNLLSSSSIVFFPSVTETLQIYKLGCSRSQSLALGASIFAEIRFSPGVSFTFFPNNANILRHPDPPVTATGESSLRTARGAFPSPLAPFSNSPESAQTRLTGSRSRGAVFGIGPLVSAAVLLAVHRSHILEVFCAMLHLWRRCERRFAAPSTLASPSSPMPTFLPARFNSTCAVRSSSRGDRWATSLSKTDSPTRDTLARLSTGLRFIDC